MTNENPKIKNVIVKPYDLPEPIFQELSTDQKYIETKEGYLREERIKNFREKMKGRNILPKPLKTK